MNSPERSTQPAAQGQPPGPVSNGHEQAAGSPGQFEQTLQRQLSDSLQPILGSFQQRVVDSVRQQMRSGSGSSPGEQTTGHTEASEDQPPEPDGMQAALHQSTAILRQTTDWLTGVVHLVVDSVRHWLDEVMDWLRRMAMSAIVRVIKAIVHRLMKAAIERAASGLEQQGKQKLETLGQSAG